MFAVIATVLNERNNLPQWLDGLLAQSVLPDEILIVDGGSIDGTWEYLEEKSRADNRLKVFQRQGNISVGRNFAISKTIGDLIVVTDAGCSYHPDWFKKITQTFSFLNSQFAATAFGPWFKKEDDFLIYLIASATIPAPGEFVRDWLPSSRSVAFSKELWQKVGGYPEWLPICEDVVFDLKINKLGVKPEFIRDPLVFWRPRITLIGYFKQLFRYTKSDGHAGLWLHRQLIRYFTYLATVVLIYWNFASNYLWGLLILAGLVIYIRKFWIRWLIFTQDKSVFYKLTGLIVLPLIIVWGDLAKMCGWPMGIWERKTHKVKFEKYL